MRVLNADEYDEEEEKRVTHRTRTVLYPAVRA